MNPKTKIDPVDLDGLLKALQDIGKELKNVESSENPSRKNKLLEGIKSIETSLQGSTVDLLEYRQFLEDEHLWSEQCSVINALCSAMNARDPRIYAHADRVRWLSVRLGKRMKLDDAALEPISQAVLLCYIGLISTPDDVLKGDRLTDRERAIFQDYPFVSHRIVHNLPEQLGFKKIEDIVLHHSESYNGKGYPSGRKGEEIPLGARIIRVAADFDLRTNKNLDMLRIAYELPSHYVEPRAAIDAMKELAGVIYDPEIIKCFSELYEKELVETLKML